MLENGGSDPDSNGTIGTGAPAVNSNGIAVGVSGGVIDSDGDGLADYLDLDADGDGIFDLIEVGGSDNNGDGMIDNYTDANGDGADDHIATRVTIEDINNNGLPDYLESERREIQTGLNGVGGCSVASRSASVDPVLPLLLLFSILMLAGGTIRKVLFGRGKS